MTGILGQYGMAIDFLLDENRVFQGGQCSARIYLHKEKHNFVQMQLTFCIKKLESYAERSNGHE